MAKSYDVIIIGAGPAAWAAAIYTERAGLSTVVIGLPDQSGAWDAPVVYNYPGFPDGIGGRQLMQSFVEQAKNQGVTHQENQAVDARREGALFKVKLDADDVLEASSLILAVGKAYLKAGIKNEDKFKGKGVAFCVACDGPLYKGKKVAVLGAGNFAAEEAIELLAHTNDITLFSNGEKWTFTPRLEQHLIEAKIPRREERLVEITGSDKITGLRTARGEEVPVEGIFMAFGTANALSFALKLGLEMSGEDLKIDREGRTNLKGVYAAGMATGGVSQIGTSVGDGIRAANALIRETKGLADYKDHT